MSSPQFISPWIHQLNRQRPVARMEAHVQTDQVIVGAGISGVMTAYFLLKQTTENVLLMDGGKVAHAATGHNAGQLVSYFERPFSDIAREYGLKMAAEGQVAIESSWDLLDQVVKTEKLTTPLHTFKGYAGCLDLAELLQHLENNAQKKKAKIDREAIYILKSWAKTAEIPAKYRSLYQLIDERRLRAMLQTTDARYVAVISGKKGCMNSAAFCEELVGKMLAHYPDRFQLFEHVFVKMVNLLDGRATVKTDSYHVEAKRVILCTNGFERIKIRNIRDTEINHKFHHLVRGSVGYMAAFFERSTLPPTAISYFPAGKANNQAAYDTDPYFYLTRRPYEKDVKGKRNLVCVGGPEALMDDTNNYKYSHPYPAEARKLISRFLVKTYAVTKKRPAYAFFWHGLMGYTPNGLRCVGFEPCNPVLLYNLGCNGVGILPSIYGGYRIAQLISGKKLRPSIFDPLDQSCVVPLRYRWWQKLFGKTKAKRTLMPVLAILATVLAGTGYIYLLR